MTPCSGSKPRDWDPYKGPEINPRKSRKNEKQTTPRDQERAHIDDIDIYLDI